MTSDPAAMLDALLDLIATRVASKLAANTDSRWPPLLEAAAACRMTPRHFREFCDEHGVPIGGTRKAPLVDAVALERAKASTAKTKRPRIQRDTKPANEISDDDVLAANGIRRAPRKAVR